MVAEPSQSAAVAVVELRQDQITGRKFRQTPGQTPGGGCHGRTHLGTGSLGNQAGLDIEIGGIQVVAAGALAVQTVAVKLFGRLLFENRDPLSPPARRFGEIGQRRSAGEQRKGFARKVRVG